MRFVIVISLFVAVLVSCNTGQNRFDIDPGKPPIDRLEIKRYGRALFEADTANLKQELLSIQPEFEIFLGDREDVTNPVGLQRIHTFVTDTLLRSVYEDCMEAYPDLQPLEATLLDAFTYFHHYFPDQPLPTVFTYVSGFDYEHKVQFANHNLLIALDLYLGPGYFRYKQLGLPAYVISNFSGDYLPSDCLYSLAGNYINIRNTGDDLLDRMILEGKMHWFIRAMMPEISDQVLFKYDENQMKWARDNEGLVWGFIVENEMLYSSEPLVRQKFLAANPFTSYFGQQSPARLGVFIGYRIVENYMERNSSVSLQQLLDEYDATKILRASGYKPEL